MSSGDITGLVAVVLIFGGPLIGGLVALIVNGWIKTARHREETELKHRLVDADFTADEIERILNAGRGAGKESEAEEKTQPESDDGPKIRVG